MPAFGNYPDNPLVDMNVKHKPEVIRVVKAFARRKPWRGPVGERKHLFRDLHDELCRIYGMETRLVFQLSRGSSGSSYFSPMEDVIGLKGRLSVISYLHEFAHARFGSCERKAVRWSVNLFRKCFPKSFERMTFEGHMARATPDPDRRARRALPRISSQRAAVTEDGVVIAHRGQIRPLTEVLQDVRPARRRARPECPDDDVRSVMNGD